MAAFGQEGEYDEEIPDLGSEAPAEPEYEYPEELSNLADNFETLDVDALLASYADEGPEDQSSEQSDSSDEYADEDYEYSEDDYPEDYEYESPGGEADEPSDGETEN